MKFLIIICFFVLACHTNFSDEVKNNIRVTDEYSRLVEKDIDVQIESNSRSKKNNNIILTVIGEVASPVIDGDTLQATSVVLKGNRAYVSYNMQGDAFKGAAIICRVMLLKVPLIFSN